ncbi:2-hydroxychromene-2-carboxylate isomerase [Herbaspirillum rhizosphaerae]|uniref:2-hydroxychromene-2-carboxylate isomerase n=1 Tax=Herbaspirillum rhizosphaerae TaxID=346179 RepID=UPI00067E418F|nr:2-hydroxychromene-2-carboxylate isomerase [Herbaspirillum rhizosphaerae]
MSDQKTPIDFYFDFSSPYGYFGSLHIEKLAAQYGRAVNWHAILLGPVFKVMGIAPIANVPLKGEYSHHDMERTARFHNILFKRPDVMPIASQHAARAVLWAQKNDAAKAVSLIHTLYSAYFTENIDISKLETVLRIAGDVGIDAEKLTTALNDDAIKDALKAEVAASIERGVFGSPFVIVDGESFWGFDRFNQLEVFLKDGKI